MRAQLPALAHDIEIQIRAEIPEYGDERDGATAANLRTAVSSALSAFVAGMSGQRTAVTRNLDAFGRLGALEAQAGRSHDTLQLAYRVATHHVAEHLSIVARRTGIPPAQQGEIRHAVLCFVERLARLTRTAYDEASAAGAAMQQAVTRVVELLCLTDDLSRSAVESRAQALNWAVPDRLRAIEFVPESSFESRVLHRLQANRRGGQSAPPAGPTSGPIVARLPGRCVGFLAADGDLAELAGLLPAGAAAVIGPEMPLLEASCSARIAFRAARRVGTGAGGLVRTDDRLLELFGTDARDVMSALALDRLRPLDRLGIVKRMKAAVVLSALLEFGGLPRQEAELDGISPRTWQYRKSIVEQLFGPALRDRDSRVELILALRWAMPGWQAELARHERRRTSTSTGTGAGAGPRSDEDQSVEAPRTVIGPGELVTQLRESSR